MPARPETACRGLHPPVFGLKLHLFLLNQPGISAMHKPLQKEFNYYRENFSTLLEKYNGRFVVIKDCRVIGSYTDEWEAITQTTKEHELGTFFVQCIYPDSINQVERFNSRVSFS